MCGINCILSGQLPPASHAQYVRRMNTCLKSRGPDKSTIVSQQGITFGHTLLNIRSATNRAKQPLSWQKYTLVFNGEIYNLDELRVRLKNEYTFFSESDGEILLYLFHEYGTKAFRFLNGEFAFLLWDKKEETLYAVVDHLAIKQLYYAKTPEGIFISSEIKSLLTVSTIGTQLNYQSMYDVLTLGCCLGKQTMYANINYIEGGTYLTIKNKDIRIATYYQLPTLIAHTKRTDKKAFVDTVAEVQHVLTDAIEQRTVGQYGIASSLSGGVDSGLVSIIAHKYRKDILALCGNYPASSSPVQEKYIQEIIVKLYGLPYLFFSETKLTRSKLQLFSRLQDDIAYHPSHFGRIDLAATCVKKNRRVLLVGDGADELFLGYPIYMQVKSLLEGKLSKKHIQQDRKLQIILNKMKNNELPYWSNHFLYTDEEKKQILPALFQKELLYQTEEYIADDLRRCSFGGDILNVYSYAELKYKMRQVITYYDRLASHFSLEIRFPFLDRKLLDIVLPIASSLKMYHGNPKAILRKIYAQYVPKHIAYAGKSGMFSSPPEDFMLRHLLRH